ncbi:MAG: hypothetical protein EOM19_00125 [Candidatus Moranbacteria bacterium]|nr:hypothetical protein [Candidatus Moranbacteria bacterium]
MKNKKFVFNGNKILLLFLLFLLVGVLVSVVALSFFGEKEIEIVSAPLLETPLSDPVINAEIKIELPRTDFFIGDFEEVKVMLDRDGEGPEITEDVTTSTVLYSNDSSIAEISNILETKGQLMIHKEGKTSIVALYEDMSAESEISVENPKLSVYCKASSENVKKGEPVMWIVFFSERGVPNYSYSWKGTDNFVGDLGMVTTTYETSGTKKASVEIVDMVGNKANAECTPLEVIE